MRLSHTERPKVQAVNVTYIRSTNVSLLCSAIHMGIQNLKLFKCQFVSMKMSLTWISCPCLEVLGQVGHAKTHTDRGSV